MKKYTLISLTAFTFLPSLVYTMDNSKIEKEFTETQIVLEGHTIPTSTPSIQRFTMQDTTPSSKEWLWKSPYDDEDCTQCREVTCGISLGVGGISSAIKGIEALCCTCIPRDTCHNNCNDLCANIWFPTGYDNCHYGGDVCCSILRWAVTLSMITAPVVGMCACNPFCNEDGPHCCCKRVDKEPK